jgi:hypothetical protein
MHNHYPLLFSASEDHLCAVLARCNICGEISIAPYCSLVVSLSFLLMYLIRWDHLGLSKHQTLILSVCLQNIFLTPIPWLEETLSRRQIWVFIGPMRFVSLLGVIDIGCFFSNGSKMFYMYFVQCFNYFCRAGKSGLCYWIIVRKLIMSFLFMQSMTSLSCP